MEEISIRMHWLACFMECWRDDVVECCTATEKPKKIPLRRSNIKIATNSKNRFIGA